MCSVKFPSTTVNSDLFVIFLRSQLVSGMQVVGVEVWSHKSGLPNYIYKYIAYSSSLSPLDISFAIRNNSVQKCAKSSWTSFSMWDRNLYRTASNNEYNTVIIKPSYVPFSSPQNMATKSMAMILPKTRQHFVSRIPSQMGVPEIRGYIEIFL